ncbi:Sodium:solute symporter family protein [Nonomuraea jiangxiensis]|uniref:Sodium:solute symporter family protein n=1 Tax=Nonomuraea jiangxiensis TaxID=633440 RepID=A0A1G8A4J7_9ACTN|nr:Sodium:solute symporter family protein [Nonomuraea jiangxiensis]
MVSPLEYLARRYNVPTQQALAYSGALLKVVDIAAKWVAIAVLLRGFTGLPIVWGIAITGAVTLVYITAGGLWADVLTDFGQFIIQGVAGIAMFFAFLAHLGGVSSLWTMWDRLPEGHGDPFSGPYTVTFFLALLFIKTFEYNGGMWNLVWQGMVFHMLPGSSTVTPRTSRQLWTPLAWTYL